MDVPQFPVEVRRQPWLFVRGRRLQLDHNLALAGFEFKNFGFELVHDLLADLALARFGLALFGFEALAPG